MAHHYFRQQLVATTFLVLLTLTGCNSAILPNVPEITPQAVTTLANNKAIYPLSGAKGSAKYYKIAVPTGGTELTVAISGGSGNADLYVRYNSTPTTSTYTCRPYLSGNAEKCYFKTPKTGSYYLMVRGRSAYSNVKLLATYKTTTSLVAINPDPTTISSNYTVSLIFGAGISEAQKQVFYNAANRWRQVIVGDELDYYLSKPANACGQNEPAYEGMVDDIVVYVNATNIDGAGNTLGRSGPCALREENFLPFYATLTLDSADMGNALLQDIIYHELGHALGFSSSILKAKGLTSSCPTNDAFGGAAASSEWRALGGGSLPLETSASSGTNCSHWDEDSLKNELMTGWLTQGTKGLLSRVSVGAMQDLGYQVNYSYADAYTMPVLARTFAHEGVHIALQEEVLAPGLISSKAGGLMKAPLTLQ